MSMEQVVELSEAYVSKQLTTDSYRSQLVAAIIKLDQTDLTVLAIILIEGPHRKQ